MAERHPGPTTSSRELNAVLNEAGGVAEAITAKVHRTMLWRYRTGRRSPELETAELLETLTGGRVSMRGWTQKIPGALESHEVGCTDPADEEPQSERVPDGSKGSAA